MQTGVTTINLIQASSEPKRKKKVNCSRSVDRRRCSQSILHEILIKRTSYDQLCKFTIECVWRTAHRPTGMIRQRICDFAPEGIGNGFPLLTIPVAAEEEGKMCLCKRETGSLQKV